MKNCILISLFLTINLSLFSQEKKCSIIPIESEYYKGVILSAECDIYSEHREERFTPTTDEVYAAEGALHDQLYNAMIQHPIILKKYAIKDPEKYFRKWKRQYVGFVNTDGEKIIELNLLNMKARKSESRFEDWQIKYILGFGKFYEQNTR